MIRHDKRKRKWVLYTRDGSRVLGTHDTYEEALRQERAIQWSKHHRKNPKERLYCFKPLNLFWTNRTRFTKRLFHVTPYLNRVLDSGVLLPPSLTGKSVLGENIRSGKTIRGCLLSFFDDFQTAMNGCYTLSLYAMLKKRLISEDQLRSLIDLEIGERGISDKMIAFDPSAIYNMIVEQYRQADIGTVFKLLEYAFEFQNPRILTDAWVDDLPDDIQGILDAIGVLEVEIDRKYIADPCALTGSAPSIYGDGYADTQGDFGFDIPEMNALLGDMHWHPDRDVEMIAVGNEGSRIAREVNEICRQGVMHLEEHGDLQQLLLSELRYDPADAYTEADGSITIFDEITFVKGVSVSADEIAIWNPLENEWRIPILEGLSVGSENVVALAGEVQVSAGGLKITPDGDFEIRGRRKNPNRLT